MEVGTKSPDGVRIAAGHRSAGIVVPSHIRLGVNPEDLCARCPNHGGILANVRRLAPLPNLIISESDTDDVIAYILGLKQPVVPIQQGVSRLVTRASLDDSRPMPHAEAT
jgi:hypothetical protein